MMRGDNMQVLRPSRPLSILFISSALIASPAPATAAMQSAAAVHQLFAHWESRDRPGCAASVVRGRQLLFNRGYGAAIVETGTPITPATAFQIASVSKQFTAFAIHLLRAEGKLSLDDDVRKYVPELHRFGAPITLRHLLHHMSGLRDEQVLMLKGRRAEDIVTQDDVLRVIFDQRELSFAPGSRFSYSNSNYTLLALVVERVSGQRFGEFLASRVFSSLGMKNSYVQDDFRKPRAGEAWPYGGGPDGVQRRLNAASNYGAGNIRSTAEDMALWAMNLLEPKVGTEAMIADMLEAVRDEKGPATRYASGFEIGRHRDMTTVEHGGIAPGSSAYFLVIPARGLGVTILCNDELNGLNHLARGVADAILGGAADPEPRQESVILADRELRRFVGTYREDGGALFAVELRDGKLFMQGEDEMIPVGNGKFVLDGPPVAFSFRAETVGAPFSRLTVHDPDQDRIAYRIEKAPVEDLRPDMMGQYAGDYYSPELRTVISIAKRGDELWLSGPTYETRLLQPPQRLRDADTFHMQSIVGGLQFVRDETGRVTEVAASNGRFVRLRFLKLDGLPKL